MGYDSLVGNLRNGSNDGLSNVNCRNDLSRANWNYGCCDLRENPNSAKVGGADASPLYKKKVLRLSCALFDQALQPFGCTCAECAKWLKAGWPGRVIERSDTATIAIYYRIKMKKKCKNVDISDREFIRRAIHDCEKHKTLKELITRPDVKRLEAECGGSEEKLIDIIQAEILNRHIVVDPIEYDVRKDKSNGKTRIIAVECMKQQIYDYIAYNSLDELAPYIGYYQMIDLNPRNTDAHVDVLGYKIYRDHITMRHRDYVKTIRAINTFNRKPTVRHARQLSSYSGLFIDHSNSLRFCRKYNYFKISKKARKVISQHDKSIIQREAARSQNDAGGRY